MPPVCRVAPVSDSKGYRNSFATLRSTVAGGWRFGEPSGAANLNTTYRARRQPLNRQSHPLARYQATVWWKPSSSENRAAGAPGACSAGSIDQSGWSIFRALPGGKIAGEAVNRPIRSERAAAARIVQQGMLTNLAVLPMACAAVAKISRQR